MRRLGLSFVVLVPMFVGCGPGRDLARSEGPVPTAPVPTPATSIATPAASVDAPPPSPSARVAEEKPAPCSQALLGSILEPDRLVSATPGSDERGRVVTIACQKGEADQACRKRAEGEALRDAPRGAKAVGSIVGEGSASETMELVVDVDGQEQKWSVKNMRVADKRLEELAASGKRVSVKSAKRPIGRRATILVKEPGGAPREFSATLLLRSSDSVDAEIVEAARLKGVQVRAARRVDDKTWEVEVECKVESAEGPGAP